MASTPGCSAGEPGWGVTNSVSLSRGKPIWCVAFNTYDPANQDLLAAVCADEASVYRAGPGGRLQLLQVFANSQPRLVDGREEEREEYHALAWTLDPSSGAPLLLLAGRLAIIQVIDVSRQARLVALKGHGKELNALAVHPTNPSLVISGGKDQSIRLWNIQTATCVLLVQGRGAHVGEVFTLDFHPWDPYLFASGAMDGAVKLWSLKAHWQLVEQSCSWDTPAHERCFPTQVLSRPVFSSRRVHDLKFVDCVRWLGEGLLLSKSVDFQIKLWRPVWPGNWRLETSSTFVVLRVFDTAPAGAKHMWWVRFSLSPDGTCLAAGGPEGVVSVVAPGELDGPQQQQQQQQQAAERGSDTGSGGHAAAGAAAGCGSGLTVLQAPGCKGVVRQTAVSLDGRTIVAATDTSQLWRWDWQEKPMRWEAPGAAGGQRGRPGSKGRGRGP